MTAQKAGNILNTIGYKFNVIIPEPYKPAWYRVSVLNETLYEEKGIHNLLAWMEKELIIEEYNSIVKNHGQKAIITWNKEEYTWR